MQNVTNVPRGKWAPSKYIWHYDEDGLLTWGERCDEILRAIPIHYWYCKKCHSYHNSGTKCPREMR